MYVTVQGRVDRKGEKRCGIHREVKKQGKNAVAYAAERLVLQETFLKLKICGL